MPFVVLGPLRARLIFLSIKRKASDMRSGSIRQDSGSPEAIRGVSEASGDARHTERAYSLSLHCSDKASGYAPGINAARREERDSERVGCTVRSVKAVSCRSSLSFLGHYWSLRRRKGT